MLLWGNAGSGKTHLLCDTARLALERGQPAVLVLGQQLGVGNPWDEVMKALRFDGEAETFLQALTARAEASQQRALLIIDAINENNGLQLWPDHLAAFLTVARRFPWVGVILSVRTVAKDMILPEATENLTQGWNWVRHFSARVTTNEGVSPAVTWSVEGAASAGTTISADGLLSVAANETASSLTVVATSVVDPTKTSSARVTLTPPGTTSVVVKAQAAPASIAGGGTFTLNVDVRAQSQHRKAPAVTGEIAVTFGGTTKVVPLTGGAAVITLPTTGLSAGVYPVHVAYSGDPTYAPDAAVHQQLQVR